MPQAPKVLKLPEHVREHLDMQIRASAYSGYVAISEWLESVHGHQISKSVLGEYGKVLRESDAQFGISVGMLRKAIASSVSPNHRLDDLLLELGRLRLREHQILAEIEALES